MILPKVVRIVYGRQSKKESHILSIDGLRGVAVFLVILFHARISSVPMLGGYLGVDIFFVISGFVITRSIRSHISAGTFKFSNFYARRIIRLFPALLLTMVATTAASLWILYPYALRDFSKSLMSVLGMSSNFYFWQKTGYFDSKTEYLPLIHTWSLSVEEQFYLIFPGILWFLSRSKRKIVPILSIFTLSCFLITFFLGTSFPNATFFLLPFRAWELGVGALLTFSPKIPFLSRKKCVRIASFASILSLTCILYIGWSINSFALGSVIPQLAIVFCTSIIIVSSERNSVVNRILGTKALVLLGEISYIVYLFHQPLFALQLYRSSNEVSDLLKVVDIFAVILLAWLAHIFLEDFIDSEYSKIRPSKRIFEAFGFSLALMGTIAFFISNGFLTIHSYSPSQQRIIAYTKSNNSSRLEWNSCFVS